MSCYSGTDCRKFEKQGNTGKNTRKQDRTERQPVKRAVTCTLLLWETGV